MPDRRDPPPTDEGWYALHDFRTVDWDAWQSAPERDRSRALEDGTAFLGDLADVADADEGATAIYSILGHKADLLVVHLRPTTAHLDAIERGFEQTDLARYTEQVTSYVSVTEASGYSERARDYFEGELDESSGLAKYIRSRLYPTIPDAEHVCFYPMDKRRDPEQNWYALSFEERAEHMDAHGDIGRDYGGKVTQMITGSIGLDDWEWGVTLWADDLVDVKDLLYEMRFDASTAEFAEFGTFYVGRKITPADLPALFAGEAVPADGDADPTTGADAEGRTGDRGGAGHERGATADDGSADGSESSGDDAGGQPTGPPTAGGDGVDTEAVDAQDLTGRLVSLGLADDASVQAGQHGVVCYSEADAQDLADEVADLRESFDHYDSHVKTVVRAESGSAVVASLWETERAADTAAGFLTDLTGVTESVSGPLSEAVGTDAGGNTDGGEAGDTEQAVAAHAVDGSAANADANGKAGADTADADGAGTDEPQTASIREELADLDVYAGQPHGEDVYALVVYSGADEDELVGAVSDLRDGFDRYDTHEGTDVYVEHEGETAAVVSLWATQAAADTASEYLGDLPGIVGWADDREGFGTMGMFYTVKPEYREDFVETFGEVGGLLADMDGHRETSLLANVDDENDMFIASQWDAKEDAMAFFRSEAFRETVSWGRDVLAGRPRHVFLA